MENDLKVVSSFGQVVNYQRFHNLERRTIRLGCSLSDRIFLTKSGHEKKLPLLESESTQKQTLNAHFASQHLDN